MLESPAYRVLSRAAHQVLSRIELEHLEHGGNDNGKLPVTYADFGKYGVERHAIGPGIRELGALGFIEVMERGCAGNAEARRPNLFRLTYIGPEGVLSGGTDEWKRIKTMEQATAAQKNARQTPPENRARRGGNRVRRAPFSAIQLQKPSAGNPH
jgi:hypothetical protein